MRKTLVVSLILGLVLVPLLSMASKGADYGETEIDKVQLLRLGTKFRNIGRDLSKLKDDLESLTASMTAHESAQAYLVKQSYQEIEDIEGICRYMEGVIGRLTLVDKDKLSYYSYLQRYGIELMRKQSDQSWNNLQKMRSEISIAAATELIDQASQDIRSSSGLMDEVIQMLPHADKEEKAGSHH